jgi:predicted MFS family arabinose efflux permease
VHWFTRYVLGSHASKWLAWAMVILLALVGVALLKLVIWLLTPQRDAEESGEASEKDYWRIHG